MKEILVAGVGGRRVGEVVGVSRQKLLGTTRTELGSLLGAIFGVFEVPIGVSLHRPGAF